MVTIDIMLFLSPNPFLLQLIATGLGLFVVDRAGRRILLMISIGVMGVTITGLGTYFYLSENSYDVSNLGRCKILKNKIIRIMLI